MRHVVLVIGTLLTAALGLDPALADKRVALVIGNGGYQKVAKLPNPSRDAAAIANLFRAVGFDTVQVKSDLDVSSLRRALRDFSDLVRDADIAVVFYAGHGIEVGGINYLIPVDAALERDIDVADETVSLDRVGEILEPAKRLRLVILDACRDNPFASGIRRTMANRSIGRGLARVDVAAADSMVAFAAKPGSTAADGQGTNSPYTAALLKHLPTPGLDLRLAMGRVRDEVLAATGRRQEPIVFTSLGGAELALVPGKAGAPAAPPADPAERAWGVIQNTTSVAVLETFIQQYGATFYGSMARARLEELRKNQVAAVAPAVQADPSSKPAGQGGSGFLGGIADWLSKPSTPTEAPTRPAAPNTTVAAVAPPVRLAAPAETAPKPAVGVFTPGPGVTPLSPERERGLKPKDTFKECDTCPEMVVVPAGRFTMGSPDSEKERSSSEGPRHAVTIAKPFAVGKFAVTFAEWDACVTDGGCNGYRPDDQGWGRGNRPVINVSWDDAKAYLAWLSRKTGKTYRLLSETEREYAARAGTTTPFWWGSSISPQQANYDGRETYGNGPKGQFRERTVPVDSFQPNPFGLYQVHGNVWEWTEDCWDDSYTGAPSDGSAWTAGGCSIRVLRGGSSVDLPWYLRAAFRYRFSADKRDYHNGFRVGRTLDDPPGRAGIEELKKSQVAAVTPPVRPAAPPTQVKPAVGVFTPAPGVNPLTAERERSLKPKDTFKECDACPEMVVAPAGRFTMGSPAGEKDRDKNEGPQHRVTIGKPFAVGKFAVTFAEWDACVAVGGCNGHKPSDEGWGRGNRPVINVSWNDAKTYVAWLSKKTGKAYRLLSEAEREYVTRAGTTTPFWWGSSISTSQANYDGNYTYGSGSKGEYRQRTVPVDSFQPNPFGLYQVHGNVWEWTEDCGHDSYSGASSDGSAWTSGDCSAHVLRGGSWGNGPGGLRAALRGRGTADYRGNGRGFRIARTLAW